MSSFILASYRPLLHSHPSIILFLTMLVGAGGNAGGNAGCACTAKLQRGSSGDLANIFRRRRGSRGFVEATGAL